MCGDPLALFSMLVVAGAAMVYSGLIPDILTNKAGHVQQNLKKKKDQNHP